ncbi:ABC transporter substrate-binding protein [Paenibacillus sp. S150]|uniref:ABC transporter substrate-binding protein n=1 Tax=Paenibacillus sp. S150 TaxID=2749826 RepID=UPI001C585832|nr:ABC transporter substrate-binding protein [Paenibacillus sp. S150]MBW4081118.1 ABC transporter substrate-binding protein [Paenibacillus sp. S150]
MSDVEAVQQQPLAFTEAAFPAGELDFLGNTLCALRGTFRSAFGEWVQEYNAKGGAALNSYLPEKCNGGEYADVWQAEAIADFPAVVSGFGFGNFFRRSFLEGLAAGGHFQSVALEGPAGVAAQPFVDPQQDFTIYGLYPYVLMVDRTKLGALPVPSSWSDLLRPEYTDQIIAVGSSNKISELLLLTLYKKFGDDGIIRLAANIKDGWHGRVMVKTVEAPESNTEGAGIYVIPWIFAQQCKDSDHVSIIWPEDGALVNPLFLLTRKSKPSAVQAVTEFITSKSFAEQATAQHFVMLNSGVDPGLPEGATFNWLGWDFIRGNDLEQLKAHVQEVFQENWKYAGLKNSGGC